MNNTIFDIQDDFEALFQLLEEGGGEEEMRVWFDELCADFKAKADGYARVIDDSKAKSAGLKTEIDRLRTMQNRETAKQDRLKSLLKQAMEHLGIAKLDTDLHKFSIAKNGGKQKLVVTIDPAELPSDYRTITYTANKDAIREDIAEGVVIDGVTLEPRGDTLRIK